MSRKLIGVTLLVGRINAMFWRQNIHATKSVSLETEDMTNRKPRITLNVFPIYITEDHLGVFLKNYGWAENVSSVRSGTGIAASDFDVMVTITRKNLLDVLNVLTPMADDTFTSLSKDDVPTGAVGASFKIVSRQDPGTNNSYSSSNSKNQTSSIPTSCARRRIWVGKSGQILS